MRNTLYAAKRLLTAELKAPQFVRSARFWMTTIFILVTGLLLAVVMWPRSNYQLSESYSPTGMGRITYLRWNEPYLFGTTDNIMQQVFARSPLRNGGDPNMRQVYAHDPLRNGGNPKLILTDARVPFRDTPFWSRDGSVFALRVEGWTYFAYDFLKHEATDANLSGPSTTKSKNIQALLANRGGAIPVTLSPARPASLREFHQLRRWDGPLSK
jgi:hypothetical protein